MATRTISTKLAIQGESEYRSAVSRINGEIKTLQSSLKLTQSQFQTNANSMEALTAKGNALSALYNAQKSKVDELRSALENAKRAEEQYSAQKAQLTQRIEENNRKLEELKSTTGDTTEEQKKLTEENTALAGELAECNAKISASEKGVNSWQTQLNNAEIELNNLDAELKLNGEYLDEAKNSSNGCATSIDRFGDKVKESADSANDLKEALAAAGVIQALKETAEAMKACVEQSVSFESAMAGVAKTTDLTESELSEMGESIKALATKIPATAVEIANVTEAAGQLGIKKEDLLSFSEVMVNLGVATNLSSTEAASALAKFANVVGMSADNYGRLGSTIVDLGNNFATTEADIVSMATRLASSGAIIGLSEAEIMAVATALSSVGIEAEAGGSAISKLLKQFEVMVQTGSPELTDFAAVAGMSAADFSKAWGENAVGALSMFIDGLGRIDAAGGSSVRVLEDLGISEVRLSNAVLSLASSNGILNTALDKANTAWDNNSALAKEAATRYETTESKLQLLSNAYTNVEVAVGDKLTPALGNLADTGADVLTWLGDTIEDSDALVPSVTALTVSVGAFAGAVVTVSTVTKLASAAMTLFSGTLAANPVFLAVTAVAALTAGIAAFILTADDGTESVKELTEASRGLGTAFDEANAAYDQTETQIAATASLAESYISRLKELEAQGLKTTESQDEYRLIVDKLNAVMPDLNAEIDKQTGLLIGGVDAIEDQIDGWQKLAKQEAIAVRYKTQMKAWADAELEVEENRKKLSDAEAEADAIERQLAEKREKLTELTRQHEDALNDNTKSAQEQTLEYWNLGDQITDLEDDIASLTADQKENQKEQDNLNEAISVGEETAAQYAEQVEEAQAWLDELTTSAAEAAEGTAGVADAMAQSDAVISGITETLATLAENYKAAYDAAYESIDGQIGLFDDFAASVSEDTDTVEEMISRWAEQTANLAAYTENLKLAAEFGLDNGLILSLSDGSAESAGYLATIISKIEELGGTTESMSTDAEEFVSKFNGAFAQTEEAKESFATTVASIETDLTDALTVMEQKASEVDFSGFATAVSTAFGNVGVDFQTIGENVGSGLSGGIKSKIGDVSSAANTMAQGATNATKATLGVQSPSTVFRDIGENTGEGLKEGIEQSAPDVIDAVTDMAEDLTTAMTDAAKDSVSDYIAEFSTISEKTRRQIEELKSTISGATSDMPDSMYSVGQNVVDGMISGMNSRSSSLYWTISSIVNSAISRARSAAAVASPSKKTTEIFEYVGEGMVTGLENKRKKVAETAQSVVNDALKVDVSGKIEVPKIDDRIPAPRKSNEVQSSAISAFSTKMERSLEKLEKKVEEIAEGGFVFDGDTVIGKWMPKIDHAMGKKQAMRARGVV